MEYWAEATADRIVGDGPHPQGKLLFLGAADTGKTTLMYAVASRLARSAPVAVVDADVGQSHIGPPATVGWTILNQEDISLSAWQPEVPEAVLEARGIAFVGDVTPVGHLLQLAAAIVLCVEQAQQAADVVLIDTPGLVTGGAACALWWTVHRLLRPELIIAVQREEELRDLLAGLTCRLSAIELVKAPPELRRKLPEARRRHRARLWTRYFEAAVAHTLDLRDVAVRATHGVSSGNAAGRIVALGDAGGQDMAVGAIQRWPQERAKATIRAPGLDIHRVRCLTLGDVYIDIPPDWS